MELNASARELPLSIATARGARSLGAAAKSFNARKKLPIWVPRSDSPGSKRSSSFSTCFKKLSDCSKFALAESFLLVNNSSKDLLMSATLTPRPL